MNKSILPGVGLLISIFSMLIAAWFLVHFLTILGLFLAVAYPVWWLFLPSRTPCLICRSKKQDDYCPLCKRSVNKNESISPSGIRSILGNSLIIALLSLLSGAIVLGEMKVLRYLGFPPTPRTVSFVIPSTKQFLLGEIFPMKLEIVGIKQAVNTIQTDISFDPNALEAIDVSTENSFASIFVQKEINNQVGFVRLTGGLPNPGFSDPQGTFGTIYFRSKIPGLIEIKFLPSSLVLANDGRGTNVLKEISSVSYLILPERVSPERSLQDINMYDSTKKNNRTASNSTQMLFYDDKAVLGISTQMPEEKISPLSQFLILLEKIDNTILSLWRKAFGAFPQ